MFKFKLKPQLNLKKLVKEKELDIKSMDARVDFTQNISEDVTLTAHVNADLIAKPNLGLSHIKSAKISFTKKF